MPFRVLVLMVMVACEAAPPIPSLRDTAEAPPPGGYTPAAERDSLLAALSTNERRWNAVRPKTYEARLQVECFCASLAAVPVVLVVHDDSVVAIGDTAGAQLPGAKYYARYSVHRLFRQAEAAIRDSGQTVAIDYDAQLGYPRDIHTDTRWSVTDLWMRIRLSRVRPVSEHR